MTTTGTPWSERHTLRAALGTTITANAAPYGYTLTIWSSGAILIRSHGSPTSSRQHSSWLSSRSALRGTRLERARAT